MIEIAKVVDSIRDDLKKLYLQDQSKVWINPFVAIIKRDEVSTLGGASNDAALVGWLRNFRGSEGIAGVVVGRMVAKYSQTLKDSEGNPQILERAILVSGRMLDSGVTYISITPCREHNDLRNPVHGEPNKDRPIVPGVSSPDKVAAILGQHGEVVGFKEMQFGKEQVLDSRRGDVCVLDPIIQGVLDTEGLEKHI